MVGALLEEKEKGRQPQGVHGTGESTCVKALSLPLVTGTRVSEAHVIT